MFSHVATLLSFVYALCLTHVLASAAELLMARERVKFSALQAIWMFNAALITLVNWLSFWTLKDQRTWSMGWIAAMVFVAIIQFFICAFVSPKPAASGPVDMGEFYARQRPMIVGGFMALAVAALVINAFDPSLQAPIETPFMGGLPNWVAQDLTILPMMLLLMLALFAKARWLHWAAALGMLASTVGFSGFVPVS
jgi:hypothetical protein